MSVVAATAEFIVTIDGPAGTGKSTVAHRLARRLGLEFLDTGAMYRAAALRALELGIDPADGERVAALVRDLEIRFDWRCDPPDLLVDGESVGDRIRTQEVTRAVSAVASNPIVRAAMVEAQREIASLHPRLVTEGRDQGSVVFPDAHVRIYLDARPEIRARRRVEQLAAKGIVTCEAEVLAQILERDRSDSTRRDGPLVCPRGADVVDTSDVDIDDVIDRLESIVRERAGAALRIAHRAQSDGGSRGGSLGSDGATAP
ncbi:MAG: Cytidylate kinase [Planctomycetota bacterium]